jgi:hypothetical protein
MKKGFPRVPGFGCPYKECGGIPASQLSVTRDLKVGHIVRFGSYFRSHDSKKIPRFRCLDCRRTFSSARFFPCFGQKKRRLNSVIRDLLCSSVSQRRVAFLLQVTRKTVERKFLFLADQARLNRMAELKSLETQGFRFEHIQFDEMETFERSKCLPLSIPLVVESRTRRILGLGVAVMPANGPLAEISRQKYGFRNDDRKACAARVFDDLRNVISSHAHIESDENPKYPSWLKSLHPLARHKTFKGRRGVHPFSWRDFRAVS